MAVFGVLVEEKAVGVTTGAVFGVEGVLDGVVLGVRGDFGVALDVVLGVEGALGVAALEVEEAVIFGVRAFGVTLGVVGAFGAVLGVEGAFGVALGVEVAVVLGVGGAFGVTFAGTEEEFGVLAFAGVEIFFGVVAMAAVRAPPFGVFAATCGWTVDKDSLHYAHSPDKNSMGRVTSLLCILQPICS